MQMLRMGSHGDGVKQLQTLLRKYDPTLRVDGAFGPRTERAVRLAQRRNGLYPPDGIAGPMTMGALTKQPGQAGQPPAKGDPGRLAPAVDRSRQRAKEAPMPKGQASPVAGMKMSRSGRSFIYDHEAQANVSNRLHHPSSGSGVTIGPGYDMKDRSPADVQRDLEAVRVPTAAARAAAAGATLSGKKASDFVKANKDTLNLSRGQQEELLVHILPQYEKRVKDAITVPLHQHEFDAMVSYAYNPGGGWRKTTALVNQGNGHDAMLEIKRHVYSKGQMIKSLVRRRDHESRLFLYGDYK